MAIVRQPAGGGAFQAAAAKQTGAAIRKIREAELGRQEEQRALQLAAEARRLDQQREMSQFQAQLALEREKRGMAFELEKEDRARAWQLEKMEIASRMDFEQEERERLRNNAEAAAGEKTLLESPMGDEERSRGLFRLWQKHPDAPNLQKYSGFDTRKTDSSLDIPKRTDITAAIKYIQDFEDKYSPASEGGYRKANWMVPEKWESKASDEEAQAYEYYKDIINKTAATQPVVNDTLPEPQTKDEFKDIIRRLYSVDETQSKQYYEQWKDKF